MLKALLWLALDYVFVNAAFTLWNEANGEVSGYLILCVAFVIFFTWELINTIRQWLN